MAVTFYDDDFCVGGKYGADRGPRQVAWLLSWSSYSQLTKQVASHANVQYEVKTDGAAGGYFQKKDGTKLPAGAFTIISAQDMLDLTYVTPAGGGTEQISVGVRNGTSGAFAVTTKAFVADDALNIDTSMHTAYASHSINLTQTLLNATDSSGRPIEKFAIGFMAPLVLNGKSLGYVGQIEVTRAQLLQRADALVMSCQDTASLWCEVKGFDGKSWTSPQKIHAELISPYQATQKSHAALSSSSYVKLTDLVQIQILDTPDVAKISLRTSTTGNWWDNTTLAGAFYKKNSDGSMTKLGALIHVAQAEIANLYYKPTGDYTQTHVSVGVEDASGQMIGHLTPLEFDVTKPPAAQAPKPVAGWGDGGFGTKSGTAAFVAAEYAHKSVEVLIGKSGAGLTKGETYTVTGFTPQSTQNLDIINLLGADGGPHTVQLQDLRLDQARFRILAASH